jgi:hypothetical protein
MLDVGQLGAQGYPMHLSNVGMPGAGGGVDGLVYQVTAVQLTHNRLTTSNN